MIPRIFHHIWINLARPHLSDEFAAYRQSWIRHHPEWQFRMWNLDSIDFELRRPELLARCTSYAQIADVLRLEILFRHGGIYVDTDFECFRSIDDLLSNAGVFFCSEDGRYLSTGLIGAKPRAPIIGLLVDSLPNELGVAPANQETGPSFVTSCILNAGFDRELTLLPSRLFYPYAKGEKRVTSACAGEAYAAHHWAHSWANPAEERFLNRIRRRLFGAPVRQPILRGQGLTALDGVSRPSRLSA